jgi:hypothetical protein
MASYVGGVRAGVYRLIGLFFWRPQMAGRGWGGMVVPRPMVNVLYPAERTSMDELPF